MFGRQLRRELAILLSVKVVALSLLFFFFFGPSQRLANDANAIARSLLEQPGATTAPRESRTP